VNFNVYLDDESARRLDALAKKRKVARNALVREAVQAFLETGTATEDRWPDEFLNMPADPTFPRFESHRAELLPPNEDPLGLLSSRRLTTPKRTAAKRARRAR